MSRRTILVGVGVLAGLLLAVAAACALLRPFSSGEASLADLKARFLRPGAPPAPADNPITPAKVRLGKQLFFDARLSGNDDLACAGCHLPDLAWEDGKPRATNTAGEVLDRHTPTLWNLAWGKTFFWDGRARSLEAQALMPVLSEVEMNQPMPELLAELRGIPGYREAFAAAFPEDPAISDSNLAKAIATYERTLVQPMTPFDRWIAGDEAAIGAAAKRGFRLFTGKARCVECHGGWNLTNGAFHDIGLPATDDKGRGPVLGLPEVNHAFKTPTLRDVTRRAPYMHDGSLPDLPAVIAHYEDGFVIRPTLSEDMQAIDLTDREEQDLIAFLETLETPRALGVVTRPELPQ